MRARRWFVLGLLTAAVVPGAARAEVSAHRWSDGRSTLAMLLPPADPFPFPGSLVWPGWTFVRTYMIDPNGGFSPELLNPLGGLDGQDRAPSFLIDPATGCAEVVWSRWDGVDYDIVYTRWDGHRWINPIALTDDSVDDLDPAIVDEGNGLRSVVWWRDVGAGEVWRMQFNVPDVAPPASGGEQVDQGRRPDIAAGPARREARLAFLQQAGDRVKLISVAYAGSYRKREVITDTTYTGPSRDGNLAPRVHIHEWGPAGNPKRRAPGSATPQTWIDWINADNQMGYCVLGDKGQWGPVQFEPYAGAPADEVAIELARSRIRDIVLR